MHAKGNTPTHQIGPHTGRNRKQNTHIRENSPPLNIPNIKKIRVTYYGVELSLRDFCKSIVLSSPMSRLSVNAKVEDEAVVKERARRSIFLDVFGFLAIVSTLTTGSKFFVVGKPPT